MSRPIVRGGRAAWAALCLLALWLSGEQSSDAARAGDRAPYLQALGEDRVTVCWATGEPVPSEVWLRSNEGDPVRVGDGRRRRLHRVALEGLDPAAVHRYAVRTARGESAWRSFRTAPRPGEPVSIGVFGDFGAGTTEQMEVVRLLEREEPDQVVVVGDLAYLKADDATLSRLFFRPLSGYAGRHCIRHVLGNHDVAADGGRPFDRASVGSGNGPPGLPAARNYSFESGDLHAVVVDSNVRPGVLRGVIAPWLDANLAGAQRAWKALFLHHPLYSSGEHGGSRVLRETLEPILARNGVNLVVAGHDHLYERFHPIRGIVHVVSGNGGARLYEFRRRDPRTAARQNRRHGLTILHVSPDLLEIRHVLVGGVRFDSVILAGPAAGPRRREVAVGRRDDREPPSLATSLARN